MAKEKPILFSGAMVRAIQSGAKTQTRRIVKPQPGKSFNHFECFRDGTCEVGLSIESPNHYQISCPYGAVGDQLWVREKFCYGKIVCGDYIAPDPEPLYIENCEGKDRVVHYQYAVSADIGMEDVKWEPSIHMFRKHSRIQLEITGIRVERLNDISEVDALREGIPLNDKAVGFKSAVFRFMELWDSINGKPKAGKPDYSWASNCYVWVVEFKKI